MNKVLNEVIDPLTFISITAEIVKLHSETAGS